MEPYPVVLSCLAALRMDGTLEEFKKVKKKIMREDARIKAMNVQVKGDTCEITIRMADGNYYSGQAKKGENNE